MSKAKTRKRRIASRAKVAALQFAIPQRSPRTGKHVTPGEGTRKRSAVATAYEARIRHGATEPENPLEGYPVGKLVLAKRISREDHDLCYDFAMKDEAWRRVEGHPAINPPAITNEGSKGRLLRSESILEDDLRTIRAYTRQRDALIAVLGSGGFVQFENHVLSDCPVVDQLGVYVVQMGVRALRGVA